MPEIPEWVDSARPHLAGRAWLRSADYWTGWAFAGFCSSVGCGTCGAGAGWLAMNSRALGLASMRMWLYRESPLPWDVLGNVH